MEITPIRTRRLEPPQDDLLSELDEALPQLQEGDVVAVTSKAVAIHEGRCVRIEDADREVLIRTESERIIKTGSDWDLTVKFDAVAFAGGVDESNAGGHYVLLPQDPQRSAALLRAHLRARHGLTDLGVIITDSTALPFRQGILGISIGHAGMRPVLDKRGVPDLFGRPSGYTFVNIVDALAVAAAFSMGETNESTPLCLIRNAPHVEFTDEDRSDELRIKPEEDVFYPLFKDR
jgi:coenzyme F420-0:L-glutamate ligase/coenzyme F420-1:gamma-L-glutamate ligase